MHFVGGLRDNFEGEDQVEDHRLEWNGRDRSLHNLLKSSFTDVFESRIGYIQAIDITRGPRGKMTKIEASPAAGIENPCIRLFKVARCDGVRDSPHCRKPPIVFFELVEELEILLVHSGELTSSASDTACSIR